MGERQSDGRQAGLPREQYRTPKLSMYGSLADLTASIGMNGNLDGGSGATKRSMP